MNKAHPERQPELFRIAKAVGLKTAQPEADRIDRTGGDSQAGLIRGVAVITAGEALGHGGYIDADFVQSTVDAINARSQGAKSRFTHPDLSADGLGKFLGRAKTATFQEATGDNPAVALADLHLSKAAHETPDGDLAGYVMDLADDDPAAFGLSISLKRDPKAEREFEAAHLDDAGDFQTPTPDANPKNLPHWRLAALRGVDAVDDPAANPDGLFHRPAAELARQADALTRYAFRLADEAPAATALDVHPDRVRTFVDGFLAANNLAIVSTDADKTGDELDEETPDETPDKTPDDQEDASAAPAATLAELRSAFPDATGAFLLAQLDAAATIGQARDAYTAALADELTEAGERADSLQAQLDAADETEADAASFDGDADSQPPNSAAARIGGRLAAYAAGLKLAAPPSNN